MPFNDEHVDTCVARALWRGRAPSLCDQKRTDAANDAAAAVERDIVRSVPERQLHRHDRPVLRRHTCHVYINGKIAYRDRHHLATPFAESLEPEVEKAVFRQVVAQR